MSISHDCDVSSDYFREHYTDFVGILIPIFTPMSKIKAFSLEGRKPLLTLPGNRGGGGGGQGPPGVTLRVRNQVEPLRPVTKNCPHLGEALRGTFLLYCLVILTAV